jgi:hypothetical protein
MCTDSSARISIPKSKYPEVERSRIVSAGVSGKHVAGYVHTRDSDDHPFPGCTLTVSAREETFQENTLVPPNRTTHAEDPIKFWGEMISIAEENDSDIFYVSTPTVNPSVHVEYPDNFEVEVYIGHRFQDLPPDERRERIAMIPPGPGKTHTWHLSAGLVSWQSIFIKWKKKKTPPSGSPAGALTVEGLTSRA